MSSKNDRVPQKKVEGPGQKKRFRLEKLEERIAPKKGGKGTHNCPTVGCVTTGCY